ncbi:disease resistance protein RPV1 isoform X1 [Lactuca sativa]|uniref:Disease resistance protein Roq1-like winged-helix domain-containing protein n=2 Tax=Lactuca sativa TaxID=4236 RepID=A0A9R1UM50_LACSA|nr:disease resistance protein RPV1 isoform X1 [Lactuca sativa]XP_023741124.1 disease resistance protein RPV1 isoform X1 [Lactuca sativa]KAJ0189763.1 hypothetical protein LSAT_V11C800450680 [Lactuca sativa]
MVITTNDAWLTESCALFKVAIKPMHAKHLLQGLDKHEAQQLFCFHAFRPNHPKACYKEVLERLVEYCQGHPLALQVLGKSLYNRDVVYWEEHMELLKKDNGSPINNVLRKSFESLSSKNDKELFKYIACFFVGMDRDFTETILKACDIKIRSGIMNLTDKCLLSIGHNNTLMMHRLIQEMGRFVVHQESPDKPWKRSRLWCNEESFKVLKQKRSMGNLLGLTLDMRMLKKELLSGSFELKTNILSKMDNLMLLQLNYVKVQGSYENFSKELRWLCMHGFPSKYIPSDLPTDNLVALDMSYSNIESFINFYSNPQLENREKQSIGSRAKDKKLLGSLKILNLSFCGGLRSLVGFVEFPALERLIATNCNELLEVCESVQEFVGLVYIDLRYCNKLEKLTMGMLKMVKTLLLDGCNLGRSQIEIKDKCKMVEANNIGINTKVSSSAVLEAIPSDLKFFTISLPSSLVRLSLANNNLYTESFPMDFSCLSMLEALNLDENRISSMPNCVRSLSRLQSLSMQHCDMLTLVEHPPTSLTFLSMYSEKMHVLRKVVFDPEMRPLNLSIPWRRLAPQLCEIEGMVKIQPMASVEEKVLHSLCWNKLDFLNKRGVRTYSYGRDSQEHQIQMYYEFGIFSTIYGGKDMPNWITHRSNGPSISFTILSSSNKPRGFNFCYVSTYQLPVIIIHNITKNRTWIYEHCIGNVGVGEESYTVLSHWMFRMNEMEGGDSVSITLRNFRSYNGIAMKCGVSVVYDDGNTDEEDALGYYKSWNHIIGGDLTGYQLTTGEYILSILRITTHGIKPFMRYGKFVGDRDYYKGDEMLFTALSQRKPAIVGHIPEEIGTSTCNDLILNDKDEVDGDEVPVMAEVVKSESEVEVDVEVMVEAELEQQAKRSCIWRKWFNCTRA